MSTFGKIEEFSPETGDWTQYTERLEQYFIANDITAAAKKRAILLSVCGPATYNLMRSLVAPKKPSEKSFEDLCKLVEDHHHPKPSLIVSRFKFNSHYQKQGQSILSFVAELRKLAEHCEYALALDDMLRDRLVVGLHDENIQRRLLSEKDLTLNKAMEIAHGMEVAKKNTLDIQAAKGSSVLEDSVSQFSVNKIQRQSNVKRPEVRIQGRKLESTNLRPNQIQCYRCTGTKHTAETCNFKDSECYYCHKTGHIAKACIKRSKSKRQDSANVVEDVEGAEDQESQDASIYTMFNVSGNKVGACPIMAEFDVGGKQVEMQVDTGASVSVINRGTHKRLFPEIPLRKSNAVLRTYTGEDIKVVGRFNTCVRYDDQEADVSLIVVEGSGPNLVGRDWLRKFRLKWSEICHIDSGTKHAPLLGQYREVFQEGLGTVKNVRAKLQVDPTETPKFFKSRPVPFALREKVEQELSHLQQEGIIEPVEFSDWATTIVPVVKANGKLRICGDYKVTINRAIKCDAYPIPRIEDLYATLSGGKTFTKIDLSNAYLQLPLDETSKDLTTINTHKGLFRYTRLPFGISSSPGIFQRCMDSLLQGIPNVCVYLDDILITGESEAKHLKNLEMVLKKLAEVGFRAKREKCIFQAKEVSYLGHRIDAEGLHPLEEKVRAIVEAPRPRDVRELKAYLGLLNYYGRFLPNISTVLAPLHLLLGKNCTWKWGRDQEEAFSESKKLLQSSTVLIHYDPKKELLLTCDASPYGIGAVLSHRLNDGSDKPIAFASRTLAPAEKKYAHIEREGLAVVFGVKKFHNYLSGRSFQIISDHKPLQALFGEHKAVSSVASARIQRWALTLAAYDYTFSYKPGQEISNADALSRLPLPDCPTKIPSPQDTVMLLEFMDASPTTASEILQWTRQDPTLSRVVYHVLHGWPHTVHPDLNPYWARKSELSVEDGVLLWGCRVVVPPQGRQQVLEMLHQSHPGMVRMKNFARSYVWWPNMDQDIEIVVHQCQLCQDNRNLPPAVPMHPWEWPARPWERVHIDHAGPFMNCMFLLIIDAYSKWMEVFPVSSTSSEVTINKLRTSFATHGLPSVLVSDNGTSFTSAEFQEFIKANGITHLTSAPYHPGSNGLAERSVQTFKNGMKKLQTGSIETRVLRFLFKYRVTPHSTTGKSPAELLMGRKLRTHLDLLHPDLSKKVRRVQERQKSGHDTHTLDRSFAIGEEVGAYNFGPGRRWLYGVIAGHEGGAYVVKLKDGRRIRRHADHLRLTNMGSFSAYSSQGMVSYPTSPMQAEHGYSPAPVLTPVPNEGELVQTPEGQQGNDSQGSPTSVQSARPIPLSATSPLRRSERVRKAPERLDL